ncbi:hypothetical protein ACJ2A9_09580 [Anaerobacillus sp. MEB173]|uniref:hypothetical protein n=1 Tax=Anaerobacillus sp. MEB173 TaxID=3383345 RepID=UPI003F905F21
MNNYTLTKEQVTEINGYIQQRCHVIEYNGERKPHFNTVAAYVKQKLGIRRISEIPRDQFYEVQRVIQQYTVSE